MDLGDILWIPGWCIVSKVQHTIQRCSQWQASEVELMPALRGLLYVVGFWEEQESFWMGDLEEPVLRTEVPYSPPVKCIFVLVALAIVVSASCYFKCDFLRLRVNPEALLKISQLHFFKGCITGHFFFFSSCFLLRWIVAGFSIALNYFYAFLYSLRIIFPWKYQRECGLVFKN